MNYEEHLGADQGGYALIDSAKAGVEEGVKDVVKYTFIAGTILMIAGIFLKAGTVKKLTKGYL